MCWNRGACCCSNTCQECLACGSVTHACGMALAYLYAGAHELHWRGERALADTLKIDDIVLHGALNASGPLLLK